MRIDVAMARGLAALSVVVGGGADALDILAHGTIFPRADVVLVGPGAMVITVMSAALGPMVLHTASDCGNPVLDGVGSVVEPAGSFPA